MATVSTIGTTGRNYSTIAAWDAAFANGGWEGQCYKDSEFVTSGLSINGTSAVNYIKLSAAAGQGMMDNSANPLRYDTAYGVGIRSTSNYSVIMTLGSYTTIERLGLRMDGAGNNCRIIQVSNGVTGYSAVVLNRLLMESLNDVTGYQACMVHMGRGVSLLNSVLVDRGGQCPAIKLLYVNSTSIVANNTIATAANYAPNASPAFDNLASSGFYCANNAILGWTACSSTSTTLTGSNNATDRSSFAGSTSPVVSLTYANQFTQNDSSAGSLDFKLKTGNALAGAGINTTSSGVTVDIFGTARPQGGTWDIGAHEPVVSSGYTLSANAGAFAVTGGAATLRAARKILAAVGTFAVTGGAASLRAARKVIAAMGGFVLVGGDAAFSITTAARTLVADVGAFAVTGGTAVLRVARRLTADQGFYAVMGGAAALKAARKLVAAAGAFSLSGSAATLRAARKLVAAAGSFAFAGANATLRRGRVLAASAGAFVLTGNAAALRVWRKLVAAAGALALTGGAVTFRRGRILFASGGSFVITGADAVLERATRLLAGTGLFTVTGQDADFNLDRPVHWEPVPENSANWSEAATGEEIWTEQTLGASPWLEQ